MKLYCISLLTAVISRLASAASFEIVDLGPGNAFDINDAGSAVGTNQLGMGWCRRGGRMQTLDQIELGLGWTGPLADSFPCLRIDSAHRIVAYATSESDPYLYLILINTIQINPDSFLYQSDPWLPGGRGLGLKENIPSPSKFALDQFLSYTLDPYQLKDFFSNVSPYLIQGYLSISSINKNGMITGTAGESEYCYGKGKYPRAFLFENHSFKYLDPRDPGCRPGSMVPPSRHFSDAYSVNSQGWVVGDMSLGGPPKALKHAFIYRGQELEDLGTLSGGTHSSAIEINDAGQVIGVSTVAGGSTRAFLWENNALTDLNSMLPENSGWVLTNAAAINRYGQIVGQGLFQGVAHAFLLSPPGFGFAAEIETLPANKSLALAETYRLAVAVKGTPPLTYKWKKDGQDLDGQGTPTLELAQVGFSDAGDYQLVVSNPHGPVSSSVIRIKVFDSFLAIADNPVKGSVVTLAGEIGGSYRLEYTERLGSESEWTPLTTLTMTNSAQVFIDDTSEAGGRRFYRSIRVR
ncbi:MAG TPA: hypothetical protein VMF06_03500 [Candidatus Limnocylindria bacterium]|jgi:probable HAF family extracellular repeat protein|nr:hypothetical protein [Candidatus Limnocylindria bacterium]